MATKMPRLGPRLVNAARSGERYRDVHVFFGGTGAVGGTALLQMLDMYEEMMTISPPDDDDVPILVTTGMTGEELGGFTRRLFRWSEARDGAARLPKRVRSGYLTASGVFVALERFTVVPLPGLETVRNVPLSERRQVIDAYLHGVGTHLGAPVGEVHVALKRAISSARPFSAFLERYRDEHLARRGVTRYRSVVLGIPLPSLVAYHLAGLEEVARYIEGLEGPMLDELKRDFEIAIRDDVAFIDRQLADNTLVAHTTAVGGMYDEIDDQVRIRMGFAHAAVDKRIYEKQRAAAALTELYAGAGIKMLITAAAIGVDEVRVRDTVPVHGQIQNLLFEAPRELFPGSKEALPAEAKASKDAGRPVPRRQMARAFKPLTLPLVDPPAGEVSFERGVDLEPSYVIRSGENGYFSVANADALYRVMRVASASELGQVLAVVGMFGDDPRKPWFKDHVCFYTETDNARQVFDFVAQPMLLQAQLNGLDPMSLQDLGSSKHQGELHTLGLLILLHRLRTLDIDAIPPYVDLARFDARTFFIQHSRPLLFEDLNGWDDAKLADDLGTLVSANAPEDLERLKPFMRDGHEELYPRKQAARRQVLEIVLHAVWAIPSLGSPIVFERGGQTMLRVGYFAAPLACLITDTDRLACRFSELHEASGSAAPREAFINHYLASGGFIDVRPRAILSTVTADADVSAATVHDVASAEALRALIDGLEPYSIFSTCGLIALMYRLRALGCYLREAMTELGTLQDCRWHMPRDEHGHTLVVPGVVEAFRMASEGLEKTTGTDRLAGIWGYERRSAPDRRDRIPGV